jgi:predicted nucleic acid-binding protein
VILVDSSIWVDHLRERDETLGLLLDDGQVLTHPFVVGELALGNLRGRADVLGELQELPQARTATDGEVLRFINRHELFGLGIGYIDAHLLAATRLTAGASLWTRDRRLSVVAEHLGLAWSAST